jgi:hypothetical protein
MSIGDIVNAHDISQQILNSLPAPQRAQAIAADCECEVSSSLVTAASNKATVVLREWLASRVSEQERN